MQNYIINLIKKSLYQIIKKSKLFKKNYDNEQSLIICKTLKKIICLIYNKIKNILVNIKKINNKKFIAKKS